MYWIKHTINSGEKHYYLVEYFEYNSYRRDLEVKQKVVTDINDFITWYEENKKL